MLFGRRAELVGSKEAAREAPKRWLLTRRVGVSEERRAVAMSQTEALPVVPAEGAS